MLSNVPRLEDVTTMSLLLAQHGIAVEPLGNDGRTLSLGGTITNTEAPYDIVRKMRASFLVLGPLLARTGEARVSLPGGCDIGIRPVDLHLKGLEQLGARVLLEGGYIDARVVGRLRGATIIFPSVSVGATENLLMAASLADGRTVLVNAAREPEIGDLARCLIAMGARIEGIDSDRLTVDGVDRLHGAKHAIIPDRIETGTYACAAAITGGEVLLRNAQAAHLGATVRTLREAGVDIVEQPRGLHVRRLNGLHGADVMTEPYPGFPTDMQAQFMALMAVADGAAMVTETIFENRFMHVPELNRMGARINVHGASAIVRGCRGAVGRAGDGDRSPGLGVADPGWAGGKGRDRGEPGLSPGSRLRGGRTEAGGLRRRYRAFGELVLRFRSTPVANFAAGRAGSAIPYLSD